MDVKEFFCKAKAVCENHDGDCRDCPLTDYCCDGIFAAGEHEVDEIVASVEKAAD